MPRLEPLCGTSFFYPRSPGGERRQDAPFAAALTIFLSTLPGRGAALWAVALTSEEVFFLSTLPGRGAATFLPACLLRYSIFYPRSPGGERLRAGL